MRLQTIVFLAILLFVQESALLKFGGSLQPDLLMLGILVLAVTLPPEYFIAEAVLAGTLLDIASLRFFGLHAICALLLPLGIHAVSRIFSTSASALLFLFTIVTTTLYYVLLFFMVQGQELSLTAFASFVGSTLLTMLLINTCSVFVLYLVTRKGLHSLVRLYEI